MNENTVMLLLNVLTSPTTVLTESQMLGVLELSGIVKNPSALKAIQFAASQPSASAQAMLSGFVSTLSSLVKLNPDSNPADYAKLEAYLKQITTSGTDAPLTYGILLPLIASIPPAALVPTKPAATTQPATPATARRESKRQRRSAA
jgi:hypothetical protein